MTLSELVDTIVGEIKRIPCPDDKKVDLWTAIILQISAKDFCNPLYINIIMEKIPEYVEKLDEKTIRSLWKETETGMMNKYDDEGLFADSLCFDLEIELLDEITKRAWRETED